jgi:hypothetical protein
VQQAREVVIFLRPEDWYVLRNLLWILCNQIPGPSKDGSLKVYDIPFSCCSRRISYPQFRRERFSVRDNPACRLVGYVQTCWCPGDFQGSEFWSTAAGEEDADTLRTDLLESYAWNTSRLVEVP